MAPTILLVEDDPADAAEVNRALADVGAAIWHAETGADARMVLKDARPDLIMLDLTLPDVDGLVLCASLGNDAADVPFMICSAGTTAEKVLSFKLGAEDFVSKPYEAAELQARVEAILARHTRHPIANTGSATEPAASLGHLPSGGGPELGRLRVDLARWRVTVDDKPLNLTPTEFQLLVFMARRPGEIISRQELARGVWGNESMSRSRTIDAYVRRIAGKLSGSQKHAQDDWPPRILNIRGLGYQLSVPHMNAA
jgi:DNA-binding response OmpR family regulator